MNTEAQTGVALHRLVRPPVVSIIAGDSRSALNPMPDNSVQCCVTSPPYYGLRDYGVAGQIGLESAPAEYVESLVAVFREVRRLLRDDGTLWLNLGDSYANDGKWGGHTGGKHAKVLHCSPIGRNKRYTGLKPKDLIGIPWMVAFALRADGWYLRSDIIWHKPNPMPESVNDRPTKCHEYLFLFAKSQRYHYDAHAIRETAKGWNGSTFDGPRDLAVRPNTGRRPRSSGKCSHEEAQSSGRRMVDNVKAARANGAQHDAPHGEWRNKRSVWTVTTKPYSDAHFATFPADLIKPCILAGTKPGDVVLDPFGGSGTTGMVALELGRRAVLVELNPEYVELCKQRCTITPGLPLAV